MTAYDPGRQRLGQDPGMGGDPDVSEHDGPDERDRPRVASHHPGPGLWRGVRIVSVDNDVDDEDPDRLRSPAGPGQQGFAFSPDGAQLAFRENGDHSPKRSDRRRRFPLT